MKSFFRYIVVSFIAIMNSCSDEIALDTELDTQLLIFGTLTNIPDIVTIEIHKTVALEKKGINPVTNAAISLYSKEPNGTKTLVTNNFEVLNNKYQSAEIITAEVGVSYWIEITLPDGNIYTSNPEVLKDVVPIDQINLNNTYPRVQFSDPDNERNFYALEVSFFNNEQFIYQDIMLSTDVLFNGNSNAFLELLSSTSGNRLSASLFNLDINSYKFYSKIISQEDELDDANADGPGQLFATPPVNLTGNIVNNTTQKKALGNFGVISISTLELPL